MRDAVSEIDPYLHMTEILPFDSLLWPKKKLFLPVSEDTEKKLPSVLCKLIIILNTVKEEQQSGSSANYDVEILHPAEAHHEISVFGKLLELLAIVTLQVLHNTIRDWLIAIPKFQHY